MNTINFYLFYTFQLEGFIKIKTVIIELANDLEFGYKFEADDLFFSQITEIINVLKSLYFATKEMQRIGYGLADFQVSWLRIERNLQRIMAEGTMLNLVTELADALNKRKADVFNTPSMVAAIYLDPRVKFKLNNSQKELAILHLKKLHIRLNELNAVEPEEKNIANNTLNELNEEFEVMNGNCEEVDTSQLMLLFAIYDNVKHIDIKCSVMDFWKKCKEEFPLIYPLSCIIHAIPAGQCFEERNFSSFSYINNARRTKLRPENVENILAIRLNREIF